MSFEVLEICNVLKEVTYFGQKLMVPSDTVAIATDDIGSIYAYRDEVPTVTLASGDSTETNYFWAPVEGGVQLVAHIKFSGDWKDSLLILEK